MTPFLCSSVTGEMQPGTVTTTNGFTINVLQNANDNIAWNCNCHGYTIADGKFWINDKDMQGFIATQTYLASNPVVVSTTNPIIGDIAVFSVNGYVKHSAILTGPATVTMASGVQVYAGGSKTTTVPIDQAWPLPNTTTTYYHPQPPTPRAGTTKGSSE